MNLDVTNQSGWQQLVQRLPAAAFSIETARACGALLRRREVQTTEQLLRLSLTYGPGGKSLREVSAWAAANGIAELSDVGVLKRLRGAADWVGHLVAEILVERAQVGRSEGRPDHWLRLIDGTVVAAPGKGEQWRLHLTYDLARQRLSHVELTPRKGAEKLQRAPVEPGEVRVGDRCYARPEGLRYIVKGGGQFVQRLGIRSLKLLHPDGRPFSLSDFLATVEEGIGEAHVLVGHGRRGKTWEPLPIRLIVERKPPEAAASSRKAAKRASQRQGNQIDRKTLNAANFLILATSLEAADYSASQVLAIYRMRWQVELLAKRLKSLFHIDRLPAKDPDLARCWLFSHLLLALLVEDLAQEFLDSPP